MTPVNNPSANQTKILKTIILAIVFLSLTCLLYFGFKQDEQLIHINQNRVFSLGLGALLAGLATLLLTVHVEDAPPAPKKWWFYPLMSALLGFCCMSLAYTYLGVWPLGERSVMIVDMHHQYAPLLAQFRDMIINGGSPLYSFEVGLGTSFLPLFGYYLASPFNLLLTLFPESMLNEGILVITLLKNMLTAGLFALCVQYIFRKRDISVMIVAILYSMMMYLLAYSWNIMWLDCVMFLPLVVMSFEKLIRTGRYLPYVLSLAYALYSNYYIAFMLCLFMVLYFIFSCIRQEHTLNSFGRNFARFSIGSALGGGLAMFLIVPVYISLAHTSAAGSTLPDMKNNFEMLALFGRHLYATTPTIRSGNLPNIYCGLLSVILLPIFATMKSIRLRRRIAYLGLLGTIAISFVINQFDLVWHGLHAPNDLPYRFSFLYCFVLVLIAYETLVHIRKINLKQICGSLAGIIGLIMLQEHFGGDDYDFVTIYVSLLLVFVYMLIIGLASRRKIGVRPAYILLLLVVTIEMVFNGGSSLNTMQAKEYFTARDDYVANDTTKAIRKAVNRTEEIGDAAANGDFYRLEFLPRRTTVDTALYDYRGITVFASSSPQNLTKFMGYIGYAVNGVNSHLYKSFVPIVDSLLGIKYVIMDKSTSFGLSNDPYLRNIEEIKVEGVSYTIYENKTALPLGYLVDSSIRDNWRPSKYDQFESINSLYSALTNQNISLFTMASVDVESGSESIASINGSTAFTINSPDRSNSARLTATVSKPGQTYTYIDCRAAESISVSAGGSSWSVPAHEPYIINTGTLAPGDTVTVTINVKDTCSGNIYVGTLDQDLYEQILGTLSSSPLKVSSFSDTHISGSIDAKKSGVVFTSIPFDEGWAVKVDGKKVETFAACDAMLAFDIGAGVHKVEFNFLPKGLMSGILISLASLALLIGLLVFSRKKVDPQDPSDNEFAAFLRLLTPQSRSVFAETSEISEPSAADIEQPEVPSEDGFASHDYNKDGEA